MSVEEEKWLASHFKDLISKCTNPILEHLGEVLFFCKIDYFGSYNWIRSNTYS